MKYISIKFYVLCIYLYVCIHIIMYKYMKYIYYILYSLYLFIHMDVQRYTHRHISQNRHLKGICHPGCSLSRYRLEGRV